MTTMTMTMVMIMMKMMMVMAKPMVRELNAVASGYRETSALKLIATYVAEIQNRGRYC